MVKSTYLLDNEDDMIDYVLSTGTLSVCINADTWSTYKSGVLSQCGYTPNHCVQGT